MTYVIYGEDAFIDVFCASVICSKQVQDYYRYVTALLTWISKSSPECKTLSLAQQKSVLTVVCGCLWDPGDGNGREEGLVGEDRRRDGLEGGEGGSERLTLDVDDVSECNRSGSVSNGFSSSKASIS
jgi:hypothetical protein